MLFGFVAPASGPLCGPRELTRIVTEGEALGFDYCAIGDHIAVPREIASKYPYSDTGDFARRGQDRQEQMVSAAFLMAKTSGLRVVTSVMVVPHRPPVLTAKMIASIDALSAGRFIWGVGVGWCEEEFAALGTKPFAERGAVTDETIAVCRELWTSESPSFGGRYARFSDIVFAPRPAQSHIPIWVGGESGPAMRRAASLGDAWYPIGTNPRNRLDTLRRLEAGIDRLGELTAEAGRGRSDVAVAYQFSQHGPELPARADNGERRVGSGDHAAIVTDLRALRDLGVIAVTFGFGGRTGDGMIADMRRFREEVLTRV
jgi:probable F420-dependent oxidoreductase